MPFNTSDEVIKETFFPNENVAEHQKHATHYRCEHVKIDRRDDQSHSSRFVLPEQQIRDLSDVVYRRDKDFTKKNHFQHYVHHSVTPCPSSIELMSPINQQNHRLSSEQFFYVPCDCQTSALKRFCQSLVNGVKQTVEFGLFVASTIAHRDQLVPQTYPFDRQSNFTVEMQQFNRLRDEYRKKSAPMKHTTTETYFSRH